ncbi:FAD-binding oxidoreductase [Limibaculum sp. M0105]|uniref:FAD-binding oxidoreductase n=1 Tax=Thermohalobaculum xanthum TaxID=2753746 RepID=A0A8J7SGB3_9RHOB|nr:FAD-binding oxidoreductase [Thermohalobaculum xanthum]MBK0400756.1 FAD-binding oxidoreductase [Thermohalobaculum xanthum]
MDTPARSLREPSRDDLDALAARLDAGDLLLPGMDRFDAYLREPRDRWQGQAAAVLRPRTTEEVAAAVRMCHDRSIGVIAISGGTGLVGGQTLDHGAKPVILSLERLNRVRAVLPDDGALIAEAGVTLAEVQAAAEAAGRLFPLSMASEGSCCVGGNLATNAGGVQVLRYGNARDLCLGVEAVLADGSIHHGLKVLRKDNTGYDLRHLLIGSEGTLGIITAAVLKLFPAPGETVTGMLAVPSPAAAVKLLHALRDRMGDGVTAFELMAGQGPTFIRRFYPDWRDPLDGDPAWRVLVEITGPAGGDLAGRAETALADLFEAGLATDGVVATSGQQREAMWWLRETIPEANRRVGAVSSHDISVPLSAIPRFIDEAGAAVAAIDADLTINCFGHVGDGNLHFNVFPAPGRTRADHDGDRPAIKSTIHEVADRLGGSISAEHGIGRLKKADLARFADPVKLAAMRAIKQALDPNGILNPGAVLPD